MPDIHLDALGHDFSANSARHRGCKTKSRFRFGRPLARDLVRREPKGSQEEGDRPMLWTIFVILLVLWLLGLVSGQVFGGFIHILLIVALVVVVLQLLSGRRVA
jgi:hypothetical protein